MATERNKNTMITDYFTGAHQSPASWEQGVLGFLLLIATIAGSMFVAWFLHQEAKHHSL